MNDQDKTKEQLVGELRELRQRLAECEAAGAEKEADQPLEALLEQVWSEDSQRKVLAEVLHAVLALQESEERFRSLVESPSAVPWRIDLGTGRFTYIGRQVEDVLGYPAESWVDIDTWAERLHSEDREAAVGYYTVSTEHGIDHDFEYRAIAADGRLVWIRNIGTVIMGD